MQKYVMDDKTLCAWIVISYNSAVIMLWISKQHGEVYTLMSTEHRDGVFP